MGWWVGLLQTLGVILLLFVLFMAAVGVAGGLVWAAGYLVGRLLSLVHASAKHH
jgi:hypothetical protein